MKNHSNFFGKTEGKTIVLSLLAAATALQLTSCADTAPPTDTEAYTETEIASQTSAKATTEYTTTTHSTAEQTTQAPVFSATEESTQTETSETIDIPDKAPFETRTETVEQLMTDAFATHYEYSDDYYRDERIVKQKGINGTVRQRITTVYEGDNVVDFYILEDVLQERMDEIIVIGTKSRRSEKTEVIRENEIAFDTEYIYDNTRYEDDRAVLTEGKNGYTLTQYRITYESGKETERITLTSSITEPITEIIRVGTKPVYTTKTETTKKNIVPFTTRYEYDDTLAEGTEHIATNGANGYTEEIYQITYYKGTESDRVLLSSKAYAPVEKVVIIGTKKEEAYYMPFLDAAHGGRDYSLTQGFSSSHRALDFGVWYGEPIVAIKAGTVIAAYNEGYHSTDNILWTYGTYVIIEHEDGMRSYYAHLKNRTVSVGDTVSGGEIIGYSGNTGRVNPAPTPSNPLAGTHLHFEIRIQKNGYYQTVDPREYLPYWN